MSATLDLKVIGEADKYLDAEVQLTEFRKTGETLFEVFGADEGRVSTQVRNLQQIAVSVRRLSDIEVFVKNQMGKKSGSDSWRRVGDDILTQLNRLRAEADLIPITVSVLRLFSKVEGFVKYQMRRGSSADAWQQVGRKVLDHLAELRAEARNIASDEGRLSRWLSDMEGWVKSQISIVDAWQQAGGELLDHLAKLHVEADLPTDEGQRLLLRAYLSRGWVKTLVGAYLYAKAHEEMRKEVTHA